MTETDTAGISAHSIQCSRISSRRPPVYVLRFLPASVPGLPGRFGSRPDTAQTSCRKTGHPVPGAPRPYRKHLRSGISDRRRSGSGYPAVQKENTSAKQRGLPFRSLSRRSHLPAGSGRWGSLSRPEAGSLRSGPCSAVNTGLLSALHRISAPSHPGRYTLPFPGIPGGFRSSPRR